MCLKLTKILKDRQKLSNLKQKQTTNNIQRKQEALGKSSSVIGATEIFELYSCKG